MSQTLCVAAARHVDGVGSLSVVEQLIERLMAELQLSPRRLTIDPLSVDWHSPVDQDHFRSGCGPIEAIKVAYDLIASGEEGAVLIEGRDFLRSEYGSEQRRDAMSIYPDGPALTEAYDQLTQHYLTKNGLTISQFLQLRDLLFENHWRCFSAKTKGAKRPSAKWFESITELFRGVDCANPVIDFDGKLLLCSRSVAADLRLPEDQLVTIVDVALGSVEGDGPAYADDIARYQHLSSAVHTIETSLNTTVKSLFERGLLLDLYTCYPVVPIACLRALGLATTYAELLEFIEKNDITQTGGMNLARGAWNNPALNGLVAMYETLSNQRVDQRSHGLVHGNGGLGYRQGLVLMS
ncbi:MAG: hypothetical protein ACRBBW_15420 [Cellvibrionaceae bacterium]